MNIQPFDGTGSIILASGDCRNCIPLAVGLILNGGGDGWISLGNVDGNFDVLDDVVIVRIFRYESRLEYVLPGIANGSGFLVLPCEASGEFHIFQGLTIGGGGNRNGVFRGCP